MPINAGPEYFKAEQKYEEAKTRQEKILALEEMIRTLPKHKGTEHMLAGLRSKLSKLKKEAQSAKKGGGGRRIGISKQGDAQVCIIGNVNSGKSTMLKGLTGAKPLISNIPYTTVKPEVGTMDYNGIKIQIVEIPSTFDPEYLSIARTSDLIAILAEDENEKRKMKKFMEENYIRVKKIFLSQNENPEKMKEKIWKKLGMIIAYAKKTKTPMALKHGSTVRDFTERIHKDFIENFHFARIFRRERIIQAGLKYRLQDGDIVEIHTK